MIISSCGTGFRWKTFEIEQKELILSQVRDIGPRTRYSLLIRQGGDGLMAAVAQIDPKPASSPHIRVWQRQCKTDIRHNLNILIYFGISY